jgi:FkbM family methyltransferase
MFGRIKSMLRPLSYIPLSEWPRFLAYRRGLGSGETVFHVKGVAHGLRVRAATTDAVTMESVFGDAYHLPRHPIKDECVILDLGANAGYAAAHLASMYPEARVIAVELDAENAELARRNLVPFDRCELVNAAIWIADGEVGYSGKAKDGYAITGGGMSKAPAITIETLLDDRGIKSADFVKMDIEGAEWPLFQEPKWLSRINSISVEVHQPEWLEPIDAALIKAGFRTARSDTHWSSIFAHRDSAAS